MWKTLTLADLNPMKSLEKGLLKERDKYLSETNRNLGHTKIIVKKKKVINRDN